MTATGPSVNTRQWHLQIIVIHTTLHHTRARAHLINPFQCIAWRWFQLPTTGFLPASMIHTHKQSFAILIFKVKTWRHCTELLKQVNTHAGDKLESNHIVLTISFTAWSMCADTIVQFVNGCKHSTFYFMISNHHAIQYHSKHYTFIHAAERCAGQQD